MSYFLFGACGGGGGGGGVHVVVVVVVGGMGGLKARHLLCGLSCM